MSLPSAVAVCDMSPMELAKIAKKEEFKHLDLRRVKGWTVLREKLLSHIAERRSIERLQPALVDPSLSASFEAKRKQCLSLFEDLETLICSRETKQLFQGLKKNTRELLYIPDSKNLQKAKNICESGKPWLLVAGTTSAGKSTFINFLLGEDLLPVAHKLTTSALCEIKYAESKHHKRAILHRGQDVPPLELNLEDPQDFKVFYDLVTCKDDSICNDDHEHERASEEMPCTRAEIFLHNDLLKCFTLVDSPGVSDARKHLRDLTKGFQENDNVCGFLYVLNVNLSPEEAAQVGNLVAERLNAAGGPQSLKNFSNTLFVVNKWDTRKKDQDQHVVVDYEKQVFDLLRQNIKYLQRYQVLPMHARLCRLVRRAGEVHPFMQRLIDRLQEMLPRGMDDLLARAIEIPLQEVYQNQASAKRIMQQLQLPTAATTGKHRFAELKKEIEDALADDMPLAKATTELQRKISELVNELTKTGWLANDDGVKAAFIDNKILKRYERDRYFMYFGTVETSRIVKEGLHRAVHEAVTEAKIYDWSADQFKINEELIERLLAIKAELNEESLHILPMDLTDRPGEMTYDIFHTRKRILRLMYGSTGIMYVAAIAAAGVAMGPIGLVFAGVSAAAFGIAVGSVLRRRKFQFLSWRKKIIEVYKTAAIKVEENEDEFVKLVTEVLLANRCLFGHVLLAVAPALKTAVARKIEEHGLFQSIVQTVKKNEAESHHIEQWLFLLNSWVQKACHCSLSLATFEYTASDITNVRRTGGGAFGEVFQVIVHGHEKRALKILRDPITAVSAEGLMRKLSNCRELQARTSRLSNVVEFLGAVCLPDIHHPETKRMGLVFEWCDGGTLADLIYGTTWEAPVKSSNAIPQALKWARNIAKGLQQIHSLNIAHQGIKPENILVTEGGQLKIADYNQAKDMDCISGTGCSTLLYLAPEIFNKTATSDMRPADVYSFGLLLWELWHGQRAYMECMTMNTSEFKDHVVKGMRPRWDSGGDQLQQISGEWKRVARQCWDTESNNRPSTSKVLEMLRQPSLSCS